jgi:hypothetical protein
MCLSVLGFPIHVLCAMHCVYREVADGGQAALLSQHHSTQRDELDWWRTCGPRLVAASLRRLEHDLRPGGLRAPVSL